MILYLQLFSGLQWCKFPWLRADSHT